LKHLEMVMTPDNDLVVIGGEPAGLSAAQYLSRANLRNPLDAGRNAAYGEGAASAQKTAARIDAIKDETDTGPTTL